MRFAAAFIALCATVSALPAVDTSSLTDIADTSSIVPDTSSVLPDTSSIVPDTSDVVPSTSGLAARQDHPAGPLQKELIKLIGADAYHDISSALHLVGTNVAKLERELSGTVVSLDPSLQPVIRNLLKQVDTLEADLVSIGFNT